VARAHNGTSDVRNRDDGSGCTFTLALRGGSYGVMTDALVDW